MRVYCGYTTVSSRLSIVLPRVSYNHEPLHPISPYSYPSSILSSCLKVGRRAGSDRLQKCPSSDLSSSCASSSEAPDSAAYTEPLIYYSQKGQVSVVE